MQIVWSSRIDSILSKGMFLDTIGVNNWALSLHEALDALTQLLELQVPILGGDVCELIDGAIQYNYDNWYCDKKNDESDMDFTIRSIETARGYIQNYKYKDMATIYFVFVPEVKY